MRLNVDFALTLEDRKRRFELKVAFSSDDDRVVMFGKSGAGKSATLQAIAGLLTPQRGQIATAAAEHGDAQLGDPGR